MIITKAVAQRALDSLCEHCEECIRSIPSKGDFPHRECPFRHIDYEHCDEYNLLANYIANN